MYQPGRPDDIGLMERMPIYTANKPGAVYDRIDTVEQPVKVVPVGKSSQYRCHLRCRLHVALVAFKNAQTEAAAQQSLGNVLPVEPRDPRNCNQLCQGLIPNRRVHERVPGRLSSIAPINFVGRARRHVIGIARRQGVGFWSRYAELFPKT